MTWLAFHDQSFGPDHLLGGNELDVHAEHLFLHGMLEPAVVHHGHAVARAEDQVDEVLAVMRLAQPVRERERGFVARFLKRPGGAAEVVAADEDVEVFGVALDAGVARVSVCAAHEMRDGGVLQDGERVAVEADAALAGNDFWNGGHDCVRKLQLLCRAAAPLNHPG
jgi:hypothetical protein